MIKILLVSMLGAALLSLGLGGSVASATNATSTSSTSQGGVHSTYCFTPEFDSYVKFYTPSHITPGGGPVCYDGTGTADINLTGVAHFAAGDHFGSFQYTGPLGHPIRYQPFTPGEELPNPSGDFSPQIHVLSLTIDS